VTQATKRRRAFPGLRKLRLALCLSQAELAKRSGLSQGYVSQLEDGQVGSPSIDVVARLAHGLQIPLHHLLSSSGHACGHTTRDLEPPEATA